MNEEENDSEREKEEHERDTGKEEEREAAKELLLANGNGTEHNYCFTVGDLPDSFFGENTQWIVCV